MSVPAQAVSSISADSDAGRWRRAPAAPIPVACKSPASAGGIAPARRRGRGGEAPEIAAFTCIPPAFAGRRPSGSTRIPGRPIV
jgi:hypothetical protein